MDPNLVDAGAVEGVENIWLRAGVRVADAAADQKELKGFDAGITNRETVRMGIEPLELMVAKLKQPVVQVGAAGFGLEGGDDGF